MHPQLQLLHIFCLLGLATAQCWHDGRILKHGELLSNPGDNCFNRVCRCESWDRCRLEVERKVVQVKVRETSQRRRRAESGGEVETRVKILECKCVEDLKGSHEMNFICDSQHQTGRNSASTLIGCLDMRGQLRDPGQPVTIQTSRLDTMDCECDASGHYVNCVEQGEPREACADSRGERVPLGANYNRTVTVGGRTVRLQCRCAKSDQETACSLLTAV